jgi:hypothetical protein
MAHGVCRLLRILVCLLPLTAVPVIAQMDEYSIKAGYVYNLSKYVTWPEATFSSSSAPLVICIVGKDPFEGRLDQAVAGKTAGDGRPLEIRRLNGDSTGALHACQIAFLGKSEKKNARAIVNAVKDAPVLTVADFDSFAQEGGIADLRLEDVRIKIDLNMAAAGKANLKISGKLQQVANLVN